MRNFMLSYFEDELGQIYFILCCEVDENVGIVELQAVAEVGYSYVK